MEGRAEVSERLGAKYNFRSKCGVAAFQSGFLHFSEEGIVIAHITESISIFSRAKVDTS